MAINSSGDWIAFGCSGWRRVGGGGTARHLRAGSPPPERGGGGGGGGGRVSGAGARVPAGLGQLLVWEWQSESYVLKQQGHFNSMVSLAYSPDGQYIVTGGDDGKVGPVPGGPTVGGWLSLGAPSASAGLAGLAAEALGVPFPLSSRGSLPDVDERSLPPSPSPRSRGCPRGGPEPRSAPRSRCGTPSVASASSLSLSTPAASPA